MTKKIPKTEYVKHPYTKKKLRVIDTFAPSKETHCPGCEEGIVEEIRVITAVFGTQFPDNLRQVFSDPIHRAPLSADRMNAVTT
ncbi:MAG: hypothetical protein ACYTFU_11010, partial [Planctomycetota bacterium]